ncbi:MAG: hypothetical protein AAB658_05190, partial [Chloroflexota bacterium]
MSEIRTILSDRNIKLVGTDNNYYNRNTNFPTNVSFSQIEEEINPGVTFLNRKENIENKSAQKKIELQKEIRRVEKEITKVPYKQLSEIFRSNEIKFDELLDGCKIT